MAAVLSRTQVGLKDVTSTTSVPEHPTARLMYYMNCMCTVLDISDERSLRRLIDFQNYRRLNSSKTETLLGLCVLFSPDVLLNKCIFHSEELCGDCYNRFFELSAARQTLAVTENIVIGNQVRHVQSIMTFKMDWLHRNYFIPLASFMRRGAVESSEGDRILVVRQEDKCFVDCCLSGFFKVLGAIICCPCFCAWYCCCSDD